MKIGGEFLEELRRLAMRGGRFGAVMDQLPREERELAHLLDRILSHSQAATERAQLMLDATPLGCVLWDSNHKAVDCNEAMLKLLKAENKAGFLESRLDYAPEYQPDGQRSDEKMTAMVDRALEDGECIFHWTHRTVDGTPVPSEVLLVRVPCGDGYVVPGYTRDLREHHRMTREMERQNQLLRTVNAISVIMLQTDIDRFERDLRRSMGILARAVDADRVYVWKNRERGGQLGCPQIYEWPEGSQPQQGMAKETSVDLLTWQRTFLQRRCINGVVRGFPPKDQERLLSRGIVSILLMPIFLNDEFWGVLGLDDCRRERVFSEHEEMILRAASELIANALIRNAEAAKIREMNDRVKQMLDATPFGCILWDSSLKVVGCNTAAIQLFECKDPIDRLEKFQAYSPAVQPDGRRSDEKAFELVRKAFEDGRCDFEWMHQTQGGTPIPADVTLVRVQFGNSHVVMGYAHDLRIVRKLEKNIIQLESQVAKIYYDPLTGIYNRRFFEERISGLIQTLARPRGELSVMMIDIDFFKQYNDLYGHVTGDQCLRTVADILQNKILRRDDFIARYGGEEFVAVLPNTDEAGARLLAARLLGDVRQCNILHGNSAVADCVTVSIGVVTGTVEHTRSGNDFIQRADDMLYMAKQQGRDRYVFSTL